MCIRMCVIRYVFRGLFKKSAGSKLWVQSTKVKAGRKEKVGFSLCLGNQSSLHRQGISQCASIHGELHLSFCGLGLPPILCWLITTVEEWLTFQKENSTWLPIKETCFQITPVVLGGKSPGIWGASSPCINTQVCEDHSTASVAPGHMSPPEISGTVTGKRQ
jgi:hypothetical protein